MNIINKTIECDLCGKQIHVDPALALGNKKYLCEECVKRMTHGTWVKVDAFNGLSN